MVRARIIGTGRYAPQKILTNADLSKMIDTTDEWIVSRTGIKERHIAAEGEYTSDLAVAAAKNALEMAGKKATDLDLIVVGTISADYHMPSCAVLVQAKLGAKCPAFDVSAACAGSLYALSVADNFVKAGGAQNVLVIGVELLSRFCDWQDRNTCVLFGDAAGAMIVSKSNDERRGILSTHLYADGTAAEILTIPGGGSKHPSSAQTAQDRLHYIKMNGREVYKIAVRSLEEATRDALAANKMSVGDVNHVVPHQANIRIIDTVLERLEIPREKCILNIDRYGNTSSASVPITLDEGVRNGRIREGDVVAMMAIGAGMAWGSALVRW
jgi:3-oxoacyl-[acyl-carrier-protein] synthase III